MHRRQHELFAILLALSLVAAACGNSGDDDESTDPPPSVVDERAGTDTDTDTDTEPVDQRHEFVPIEGVAGVSDTEINVSSVVTISNNPLQTNIGSYNDGIEAYFRWRNDEGGIYGRRLVLGKARDDELVYGQDAAQAVLDEDNAFAAFLATLDPTTQALTVWDGADMPVFGWSIHSGFAGRDHLFGHIAPGCLTCPRRVISWLASQVGASTVGIVGYGNSQNSLQCADTTRAGIEKYGEEAGGITVGFFDVSIQFGLTGGVAPLVSEMKENGVDFFATCIDLNGMKTFGDEFAQQDHKVTMFHNNTYNQEFVAANAEIFEGDLVAPQFVPFEAEIESESQQKFFEYTEGTQLEEQTMIGWINADLFFNGLLAAGPEFDQRKVIDAIRKFEDYTNDGLSSAVDWGRQLNSPDEDPSSDYEFDCLTAVQVVDGAFEQFTGTQGKPWVCWDKSDDAWGEPTVRTFAS